MTIKIGVVEGVRPFKMVITLWKNSRLVTFRISVVDTVRKMKKHGKAIIYMRTFISIYCVIYD